MFIPRFLVVSLGNPAPYQDTFHSIGHLALNALQRETASTQPRFRSNRVAGKSCQISMNQPYTLVQCPTLMNISGPFVARAWSETLERQHLENSDLRLVLVHDDLEEPFGRIAQKTWDSSHRGHNGMKSVLAHLNHNLYPGAIWSRISIGIGRPATRDPSSVAEYVLSPMSKQQKSIINNRVGRELLELLFSMELQWETDYGAEASWRP
ncbi:peptidyl-tRNA hydrolase [Jackrogersella minutella]|nr:peptidyl-tRNA hydrolase [Jackrogersella minutella]